MEDKTTIILETSFCKLTKELFPSEHETFETCDVILQEFITMLIGMGWQPGSIKEAVFNLADRYATEEGTI